MAACLLAGLAASIPIVLRALPQRAHGRAPGHLLRPHDPGRKLWELCHRPLPVLGVLALFFPHSS